MLFQKRPTDLLTRYYRHAVTATLIYFVLLVVCDWGLHEYFDASCDVSDARPDSTNDSCHNKYNNNWNTNRYYTKELCFVIVGMYINNISVIVTRSLNQLHRLNMGIEKHASQFHLIPFLAMMFLVNALGLLATSMKLLNMYGMDHFLGRFSHVDFIACDVICSNAALVFTMVSISSATSYNRHHIVILGGMITTPFIAKTSLSFDRMPNYAHYRFNYYPASARQGMGLKDIFDWKLQSLFHWDIFIGVLTIAAFILALLKIVSIAQMDIKLTRKIIENTIKTLINNDNTYRYVGLLSRRQLALARCLLFFLPVTAGVVVLRCVDFLDDSTLYCALCVLSSITRVAFTLIGCDVGLEVTHSSLYKAEVEKKAHGDRRAFLRYVFHEIRVPLNSVSLGIELLAESGLSEADMDTVLMMREAATFMGETLNDVMAIQKIEEGVLRLIAKPFDLEDLLLASIEPHIDAAEMKGVRIVSSISNGVPLFVIGDKFRLKHVISNMVSNAIKFSRAGTKVSVVVDSFVIEDELKLVSSRIDLNAFRRFARPAISPKTSKQTMHEDEGDGSGKSQSDLTAETSTDASNSASANSERFLIYQISIIDEGKGIEPELIPNLFNPFVATQPGELKRSTKSGIGLAISKEIIKLHGGAIHVKSELNVGSVFTIYVPLMIVDEASEAYTHQLSLSSASHDYNNQSDLKYAIESVQSSKHSVLFDDPEFTSLARNQLQHSESHDSVDSGLLSNPPTARSTSGRAGYVGQGRAMPINIDTSRTTGTDSDSCLSSASNSATCGDAGVVVEYSTKQHHYLSSSVDEYDSLGHSGDISPRIRFLDHSRSRSPLGDHSVSSMKLSARETELSRDGTIHGIKHNRAARVVDRLRVKLGTINVTDDTGVNLNNSNGPSIPPSPLFTANAGTKSSFDFSVGILSPRTIPGDFSNPTKLEETKRGFAAPVSNRPSLQYPKDILTSFGLQPLSTPGTDTMSSSVEALTPGSIRDRTERRHHEMDPRTDLTPTVKSVLNLTETAEREYQEWITHQELKKIRSLSTSSNVGSKILSKTAPSVPEEQHITVIPVTPVGTSASSSGRDNVPPPSQVERTRSPPPPTSNKPSNTTVTLDNIELVSALLMKRTGQTESQSQPQSPAVPSRRNSFGEQLHSDRLTPRQRTLSQDDISVGSSASNKLRVAEGKTSEEGIKYIPKPTRHARSRSYTVAANLTDGELKPLLAIKVGFADDQDPVDSQILSPSIIAPFFSSPSSKTSPMASNRSETVGGESVGLKTPNGGKKVHSSVALSAVPPLRLPSMSPNESPGGLASGNRSFSMLTPCTLLDSTTEPGSGSKQLSSQLQQANTTLTPSMPQREFKRHVSGSSGSGEHSRSRLAVSIPNSIREIEYDGTNDSPMVVHALVVDDVSSNRKLLAQLLAKKGLQVQLCEDGVMALETVKSLPLDTFHVIFMDNTMPRMTGIQCTTALRQLGFDQIIIGLTGNSMEEELAEFSAVGADMALTKPLRPAMLDIMLRWFHKNGFKSRSDQNLFMNCENLVLVPKSDHSYGH